MRAASSLAFAACGGCACSVPPGRSGLSPQRRSRLAPLASRRRHELRTPRASMAPGVGGNCGGTGDGRSSEYWANVGSVIDGLRADYPLLPSTEPALREYAENVTLRARAGMLCQGRAAYRGVLWLVRAQLRVCFGARSVAIHGLYHDARAGQVFVRWRLTAVPRMGVASASFVYDGLSVYTLNDHGWIQDHLLENIVSLRAPLRPLFESVLTTGQVPPRPVRVGTAPRAGVPTWCALRRGEFVPLPNELQFDDAPLIEESARRAPESEAAASCADDELRVIGELAAALATSPVCAP